MLKWSLGFFVIALIAALLGFTDIAAGAAWVAELLFILFALCFLVLFTIGVRARRRRHHLLVRIHPHSKG